MTLARRAGSDVVLKMAADWRELTESPSSVCFQEWTSMTVSLPEALKQLPEAQTLKRLQHKMSEHVRELIRTDQRRRTRGKLDAFLLEGLQSGDSIVVDAKFWTS